MTAETYNFWEMVLTSPVAIALAGGIAGSLITLVVALLKFSYDAKESKNSWERQEATRKEERAFARKSKAYEDFFACFETTWGAGVSNFDKYFAPTMMNIMLYGPLQVKISAHAAFESYIKSTNHEIGSVEYQQCFEEVKRHSNDLHAAMIEDIDIHFTRNDMQLWKQMYHDANTAK